MSAMVDEREEVTAEGLSRVLKRLLNDLRIAQTPADVAIAAGVALELLEFLS